MAERYATTSRRVGWETFRSTVVKGMKPGEHACLIGPTGRGRGVSFISATQAPRWIPKAAYDQATHQWHWPLMDRDALKRQAEISGIGREQFLALTEGLHKHDAIYVHPPDTAFVVRPPQLPKPAVEVPSSMPPAPVPESPRKSKLRERLWHR